MARYLLIQLDLLYQTREYRPDCGRETIKIVLFGLLSTFFPRRRNCRSIGFK